MQFLYPFYLLGLSFALLPLLLHLFTRKKAKVIPFSTLRFLSPFTTHQQWLMRLKEILLLFLRTLLFVFLALGMAQPLSRFFFSRRGAEVLIMDNSYSMYYQDEWKKAKEIVKNYLQEQRIPSHLYLVTGEAKLKRIKRGNLLKELENIPPYYSVLPLPYLLEESARILSPYPEAERKVVLISDLQRINFKGVKKDYPFTLLIKEVGEKKRDNIAIKEVEIKPQGNWVRWEIKVKNFSPSPSQIRLSLYREGEIMESKEISLAGEEEKILFLSTLFPAGVSKGKITINPPDLLPDNIWHYVVETSPSYKILVINGHPSEVKYLDSAFYISMALNPLREEDFYLNPVVKNTFPSSLDKYPVVMISNLREIREEEARIIKGYLEKGGKVILSLGENVVLSAYNETLAKAGILPAELLFVEERKESPFHLVSEEKLLPSEAEKNIHFYTFVGAKEKEGTEVLLRFDNGYPALLKRKLGEGEIYIFTSSLDVSWTDFPLTPYFLPFLHNFLSSLLLPSPLTSQRFTGERVKVKGVEEILTPQGEKIKVKGDTFTPLQPGIYTLRGKKEKYLAVNCKREEADLGRMKKEEVLKLLSKTRVYFAGEEKPLPSSNLGDLFLLLALFLLTIEGIFSNAYLPGKREKEKIFKRARRT